MSGQDELSQPCLKLLLHPDVATMIEAVQQDPVAFEQQFAQMAKADVLWQLLINMSLERDRSLYPVIYLAKHTSVASRKDFHREQRVMPAI